MKANCNLSNISTDMAEMSTGHHNLEGDQLVLLNAFEILQRVWHPLCLWSGSHHVNRVLLSHLQQTTPGNKKMTT